MGTLAKATGAREQHGGTRIVGSSSRRGLGVRSHEMDDEYLVAGSDDEDWDAGVDGGHQLDYSSGESEMSEGADFDGGLRHSRRRRRPPRALINEVGVALRRQPLGRQPPGRQPAGRRAVGSSALGRGGASGGSPVWVSGGRPLNRRDCLYIFGADYDSELRASRASARAPTRAEAARP